MARPVEIILLRPPPKRTTRRAILVPALFLILAACSKEKRPSNHPIASIYDRNVTKIELVELVIDDQARARQVRHVYEDIALVVEDLTLIRKSVSARLAQELDANSLDEELVRAELLQLRQQGKLSYHKYVELQLKLRTLVTAQEFAQLDKVR